jgi:hypothetical protein
MRDAAAPPGAAGVAVVEAPPPWAQPPVPDVAAAVVVEAAGATASLQPAPPDAAEAQVEAVEATVSSRPVPDVTAAEAARVEAAAVSPPPAPHLAVALPVSRWPVPIAPDAGVAARVSRTRALVPGEAVASVWDPRDVGWALPVLRKPFRAAVRRRRLDAAAVVRRRRDVAAVRRRPDAAAELLACQVPACQVPACQAPTSSAWQDQDVFQECRARPVRRLPLVLRRPAEIRGTHDGHPVPLARPVAADARPRSAAAGRRRQRVWQSE